MAKAKLMEGNKNAKQGLWRYINIAEWLMEEVDKIVAEDKYPVGQWRSSNEYVGAILREHLEKRKKPKG